MLEPFDLYAAKTGEEIVNQQLYWMMDRGDRKIAVRPEMTPTMARMVAGKINELPRPVRWFSIPNLWRYERPQRGRLREHWQLNVDVLGGDPLEADAEILMLALELMRSFKAEKLTQLASLAGSKR
jgi:histidyl-tRNA synthetase